MIKRKLYLPLLALSLTLFVVSACFYFYPGWSSRQTQPPTVSPTTGKGDGDNPAGGQLPQLVQDKIPRLEAPLNILVTGIDKGGTINGPPRPKPWRSDVIILVRADPGRHKVSLLSIPRDTRTDIPGHGLEKINHAYAYGEIPLTISVVEELIGIKVDHYVNVDFVTFARMVDIIGGIKIDLPRDLKTKHYHFAEGRQLMNGEQAYEYVTNRDEPLADIARIERQQIFLLALLKNIQDQAGALDLAKMYLEFKKSSETSLSLGDTLKLAIFARGIGKDEIAMHKVPGKPAYIDGLSYWIADQEGLERLCEELFEGAENNENK